ncbi:MAG TPA: helix-turn-helix domain-containing protein [Ktedonobacteraceae bacterium]|nr:helix-turn-helix domain-containing protein [Ktedonobacteraceae bacterium]
MPKAYVLPLTPEQQQELLQVRDHDPVPYMRTKAAALLKVSAGMGIAQVAAHGLLKAVNPKTVRDWIRHYEEEGIEGLRVKAGRGRKPSFFPCAR